MSKIRTRFAPSPTGFLHIGSLRTAIFNWIYAKATGGDFLLRIEDTDLERSSDQYTDGIFKSLKWMSIVPDEPFVLQSKNFTSHRNAAKALVEQGKAYYCYCSKEDLEVMRQEALNRKIAFKYDRRCLKNHENHSGNSPVIRLLAKQDGFTEFSDLVQGHIKINNEQMDDMILLRSDGTPTYMLSVVVDDINMGITHVIRGDDHLTNTFRQIQLYEALGAKIPLFAHIPLIHGPDGTKMSKRHGAIDVMDYEKMGILPEAFFNYLIRLGWAHGNDEVISIQEAIKWFDISDVGRSPARFDMKKLLNLNGLYIRNASDEHLLGLFTEVPECFRAMLKSGLTGIKERSKTLIELRQNAKIYLSELVEISDEAKQEILSANALLKETTKLLDGVHIWNAGEIDTLFRNYADQHSLKLGDLAKPVRCALSGKLVSPSIFEIMEIIGKSLTLKRINHALLL